ASRCAANECSEQASRSPIIRLRRRCGSVSPLLISVGMLELMNDLAVRAGVPGASVARARKAEFGDIQINAAMQLAKAEKKPPGEIAQRIVAAIEGHEAVRKAEVAGPGFVNVFLKDEWLAAQAGGALAVRQIAAGQRVVIDYSSPNVAKPLHI